MSFANATLTSDGWATGGKPGLKAKNYTDPGKPFQEGWSELQPAGTKGSNKPTAPRNYRVVYPFNAMEYQSPGDEWHIHLEHMYCFLVYDEEIFSKDRFKKVLDELYKKPENKLYKQISKNITAGPIVPLRNLPATNYGLAEACSQQEVKLLDLLKYVKPLGSSHNPINTTEAYPRGTHVHNFTLVGEIDMYDMFQRPGGGRVTEGDYLFLLVKPCEWGPMNKYYDFKPEGGLVGISVEKPKTKFTWQIVPWSDGSYSPRIKDFSLEVQKDDVIQEEEEAVDGIVVEEGNEEQESSYSLQKNNKKLSTPSSERKEIIGTYFRIGTVAEIVLSENVRKNNPLTLNVTLGERSINHNRVSSIMQQRIIRVKLDQCLLPHLV